MLKSVEIVYNSVKRDSIQGFELILDGFQVFDLLSPASGRYERLPRPSNVSSSKRRTRWRKKPSRDGPPARASSRKPECLHIDEIQKGTRRRGPSRSVGQLPVDLPDDGGIKGIVDGGGFLSPAAVSGDRGHALLIERPFEKDGFGSLDQPGQGLPEADGGKMGRSHEEETPAVFFHPPNRLNRFSFQGNRFFIDLILTVS